MALKMNKSKKQQPEIHCVFEMVERWRWRDQEIFRHPRLELVHNGDKKLCAIHLQTFEHSARVMTESSKALLGDSWRRLMWQRRWFDVFVDKLRDWSKFELDKADRDLYEKINWMVDWPLMTFCSSSRSHNRLEKTSKFHTFETRAWVHSSEVSLTLSIGFPPNRSSSPWSRLNSHIEKTGKILRKVFLKRRFASRTHGGWENSCGSWNMLTL